MSNSTTSPLVSVRNLVKKYEGFQLGPISFDLVSGRACGLLGANGAGKTTLLNCLVGQSKMDEGGVTWSGQPISWGEWKHREAVGFVPESTILYDELTVEQTLKFSSYLFETWNEGFAQEWRVRMELDGGKRVRKLSKGMKVKLSIIIGLAHEAKLLLLDEPTAGLDPDSRVDLQGLLRQIVEEKEAALLISSHLFEDIELVTDEIKILRSGTLAFETSQDDLSAMRIWAVPPDLDPALISDSSVRLHWQREGRYWLLINGDVTDTPLGAELVRSGVECRSATVRDIYFALKGQ